VVHVHGSRRIIGMVLEVVLELELALLPVHACLSPAVVVVSSIPLALARKGLEPQVNQLFRPIDRPRCSLELYVTPLLAEFSRGGVRDGDRTPRLVFEALDVEALLPYDPTDATLGDGQALEDLRKLFLVLSWPLLIVARSSSSSLLLLLLLLLLRRCVTFWGGFGCARRLLWG